MSAVEEKCGTCRFAMPENKQYICRRMPPVATAILVDNDTDDPKLKGTVAEEARRHDCRLSADAGSRMVRRMVRAHPERGDEDLLEPRPGLCSSSR